MHHEKERIQSGQEENQLSQEEKNKMSAEYRMVAHAGDFAFHGQTRIGRDHSYTRQEVKATLDLKFNVMLKQLHGELMEKYNDGNWLYCIIEDGRIFKVDKQKENYFQLDLEGLVWFRNQELKQVLQDTSLLYQEIHGFEDLFTTRHGE